MNILVHYLSDSQKIDFEEDLPSWALCFLRNNFGNQNPWKRRVESKIKQISKSSNNKFNTLLVDYIIIWVL